MNGKKFMIVSCLVVLCFASMSYGQRPVRERYSSYNRRAGLNTSPGSRPKANSQSRTYGSMYTSASNDYFSARDGYGGGDSYGGGYGGGYDSHKDLNPISALVAPLAALALLGAAAAVSTSPVLLSLAVLSSGRKRRDLETLNGVELNAELSKKIHELEVLEKYMAKIPEGQQQQEKLMATYLSCSGYTEQDDACMERVVCEYSVTPAKMADLEKDVISIVLYNIMSNKYISKDFKDRLRAAAQQGRNTGSCSAYVCRRLADN